jgi:hypothetical protein
MTLEHLVILMLLATLTGLVGVIAFGASTPPRIDATMCKVAGKVMECPETDFSVYLHRAIAR